MKRLTKPLAVALGCAGAAVAAPLLTPYLAAISLPFFGSVLARVFKAEDLPEDLGKAIMNTAAGVLTNLGSSALEQLPGALSADHNFHLEKMLAMAYLESLGAVEEEIGAGRDEELKGQAARVIPALRARIERGFRSDEPSQLFPLRAGDEAAGAAFANRFSAEEVSLLLADEERWGERLGDEVEIALRRWLGEARASEGRAAGRTQLGLSPDAPLPEPLRKHLRDELPHRIAHRVSELVKRDDFKESWVAYQRAHLQGLSRVLGRVEDSQADIRESVGALARRIEAFAAQDELVRELGRKLEEFLSRSHLPQDELARLLGRQSEELLAELRGVEERLGGKIDESTAELVGEIRGAKDELKEEIQKAVLQSAALGAARNRLRQLPAPPRGFVGRAAELDELRGLLRRGGVTISGVQGMGGVGKTALALVLAHEFKDQYPDAHIYLDLRGVSPQPLLPADVMWHVVSSFHPDMRRPDDDQLRAWYYSLLNEHHVLLVYDNVKDAAQVAPLLPPSNCLLLVTSRKHFSLRGMSEKNLDEMTPTDARELLLSIEPRIGERAAEVAEQCSHLPIALCAAAGALKAKRTLSPEDYLRRLRERKERLRLRDEERDLTVEACFGLSYELLTAELQTRWRTLAIFPSDFDAPAAAAAWQTDVDPARDALAELEEYSLLEWEQATRRYSLHDLARDYADTRLGDAEREQAGFLHAAYYLQILLTGNDLYLKGGAAIAEGLSLFDNERVNIEAGQKWAASHFADHERAAHMCNRYPDAGAYILSLRHHPHNLIRWRETALSAARRLKNRAAEGAHLGSMGSAYDDLGEYRRALEFYKQTLAIAREIGNRSMEGAVLGLMGVAYKNLGEVRRAIDFLEQWLAIARELGDRRGEGQALGNLGNAYNNLGEPWRAVEFFELRLPIAREIGDRRGEGAALGNLGIAYVSLGKTQRAIDSFEQSLVIAHEIGDRRSEGNARGNLGNVYAKLGETRRAIESYEQQLVISGELDDTRGVATALGNLGTAYAALGEIGKAVGFMEAALKIFKEIESPHAATVRGWLDELRGGSV